MKQTIKKPKQIHIMDSVDILDRVRIHVFQTSPGHFDVDFTCREKNKVLVLDDDAKKTLTNKLNELAVGKDAMSANTRGYIEEYTGRLLQGFHKCNLALIEDRPEAIDDHYEKIRKSFAKN